MDVSFVIGFLCWHLSSFRANRIYFTILFLLFLIDNHWAIKGNHAGHSFALSDQSRDVHVRPFFLNNDKMPPTDRKVRKDMLLILRVTIKLID